MALNPLEGLMSVAANHQLASGPAAGGPAAPQGHRQSPRSGRDRKWVQSGSGSGSGSGGQSAAACSTLRSGGQSAAACSTLRSGGQSAAACSTLRSGGQSAAACSTLRSGGQSAAACSTLRSGGQSAAACSTLRSGGQSAAACSTLRSGGQSAAACSTLRSGGQSAAACSTLRSGGQSAAACSTLRGQHSPENAARERSRVRNLRQAFHSLQAALPSVPPDTKLSKLDVLVLATNYIAHLTETLDEGAAQCERAPCRPGGYLHPVKKWPMRSLLYCGGVGELLSGVQAGQTPPPDGRDGPPTPTATAEKE
ncbi:seminal vesicle secretory protein 2-like [Clinocottus analis]